MACCTNCILVFYSNHTSNVCLTFIIISHGSRMCQIYILIPPYVVTITIYYGIIVVNSMTWWTYFEIYPKSVWAEQWTIAKFYVASLFFYILCGQFSAGSDCLYICFSFCSCALSLHLPLFLFIIVSSGCWFSVHFPSWIQSLLIEHFPIAVTGSLSTDYYFKSHTIARL